MNFNVVRKNKNNFRRARKWIKLTDESSNFYWIPWKWKISIDWSCFFGFFFLSKFHQQMAKNERRNRISKGNIHYLIVSECSKKITPTKKKKQQWHKDLHANWVQNSVSSLNNHLNLFVTIRKRKNTSLESIIWKCVIDFISSCSWQLQQVEIDRFHSWLSHDQSISMTIRK